MKRVLPVGALIAMLGVASPLTLSACLEGPAALPTVCGDDGIDVGGRFCVFGGVEGATLACPPERAFRYERRGGRWDVPADNGDAPPEYVVCGDRSEEPDANLDEAVALARGGTQAPARDGG